MFRLTAKFLISLALTAFLLGLLMLAIELRIVPDPHDHALRSRAQYCETVAITASLMAQSGDTQSMKAYLNAINDRESRLLSAGIRRKLGKRLIAGTPEHETTWATPSEFEQESRISIDICDSNRNVWGYVELAFQPISQSGWSGFIDSHATRLLTFVGTLAFVAFYLYLSKMLKVMNARSVPQRVRTALNTLAGGLIVADANGDIVLANDAVSNWVGMEPDALMGERVDQLPWILNDEMYDLPWKVTFTSQLATSGETMKIRAVDGDRALIVNSSPMIGNNGELRGVFIGLEDVTVLEQKEIEHKKLREEAERANSAKSDFLARMSHEIRTPMNAILGFTDVLRRGFDKDAQERAEYLSTIHSSGEHLLSLINDILDLSKVEAGRIELEKTRCSPHKIILETLETLKVKADEKSLSLTYEPGSGLPEFIQGDPVRLRQIVTNLVGNAIKFTEHGGVTVTAQMTAKKQFEFTVLDTGIGIEQNSLARIFEPFSQADSSVTRKFGGTGLGLAIAKKFAEAMGGSIQVQSKVGVGTAFAVQIDPGVLNGVRRIDATEALQARTAQTESNVEAKLPDCRILIVDDGKSNRKLLRLFLQRAGAQLVEAENGREAVDRVSEQDFDIILMDMQMPIMDGYTAATTLRQMGYVTPIVALTAHAMKQDEDKCLAAGCSHFLPKPVNSNQLLQLVSELVGGETSTVDVGPLPTVGPNIQPHEFPVLDDTQVAADHAAERDPANERIVSALPMDDIEFREIVLEFVDRLHEQLEAMDAAYESAEYENLAKLAHWLKGSGGTAGFNEFTEPARRLEEYAKSASVDKLRPAIQFLRDLTERIDVPVGAV